VAKKEGLFWLFNRFTPNCWMERFPFFKSYLKKSKSLELNFSSRR